MRIGVTTSASKVRVLSATGTMSPYPVVVMLTMVK
jgi:hypothetical protein